jgi:hypothetical protein
LQELPWLRFERDAFACALSEFSSRDHRVPLRMAGLSAAVRIVVAESNATWVGL